MARRDDLAPALKAPARVVWLTGFMAAGKTQVGRRLAQELGVRFVDTDDVVQQLDGRPIPQIFAESGEAYFRELETKALRQVASGERAVAATGGGIVMKDENRRIMQSAGPVVWLKVSVDEVLRRTAGDTNRPLLQVPDRRKRIEQLMAQRRSAYEQADYQVQTDGRQVEEIAAEVLELLRRDSRTACWQPSARLAVPVSGADFDYRAIVGDGALQALGEIELPGARESAAAVVYAGEAVAKYAMQAARALEAAGRRAHLIELPDGEEAKSLEQMGRLWRELARAGLDRSSVVVAVGGGAVGDAAGFAAACYMRGVAWINCPTTLLAQIDSCIGGKTAINIPEGKNLVGAFHHPSLVLCDVSCLTTLPDQAMLSGLAEGIKHAALFDADMFAWLEQNWRQVLEHDAVALKYFVCRNLQLKAAIVSKDPYERGERALLNFGHTVGHAVEAAAQDWEIPHGFAVAIGMVAEARAAARMGLGDGEVASRIEALAAAAGLPTSAAGARVNRQAAIEALQRDKKFRAGKLRWPVVESIGCSRVVENVDPAVLIEALMEALGADR